MRPLLAFFCLIALQGESVAGWGPSGCSVEQFYQPSYAWVHNTELNCYDLAADGNVVGRVNDDLNRFYWWNGREFVLGNPPIRIPSALPALAKEASKVENRSEPVMNFGIDRSQIGKVAKFSINGRPITEAHAKGLVGAPTIPDLKGKRRLTVIGPKGSRDPVMAAIAGPLASLSSEYVVAEYEPSDWQVGKEFGFVTSGNPTIYAQEADGTVLFRQDDANGLQQNLQAVRKAQPYDPNKDPNPSKNPLGTNQTLWIVGGLAALLLLTRKRED